MSDDDVTVCSACDHGGSRALLVAQLPDERDDLAVSALACAARMHSGVTGPVTVHRGPVVFREGNPVSLRSREWAVTQP